MLFNSEQKAHGFRIASKRAIFAPMSAANLVPLARRTVSIFLAGLLLASPVFGATRSANEERRSKLPQFEALPLIRSRQNHLLVRAYINGRPAWLGVDSGAPVSAIALHRREHFRLTPISAKSTLPVRIQINGAFNNVAIARELRLGALSLVDEPVVTVDLGGSTRAAQLLHEQEIDGIIGADILFPTKAVLDCQQQLLILKTDPEGLIHGGLLRGSPPVAGLLGGEILNRHHGIIDFGTRTLYLKR